MDVRDHFEHTWEARGRLLDAFDALTPEEWTREFDFSWKSVRNLFAHVVEVERAWVLEDIERGKYVWEGGAALERHYGTVAGARARAAEVEAETRRVLAAYVPSRMGETRMGLDIHEREVPFTVEQILTHVFTHELRHQGQLQAMLRLLGRKAPNADWI
jgi:uncharacterized damage-inducible protein DinB